MSDRRTGTSRPFAELLEGMSAERRASIKEKADAIRARMAISDDKAIRALAVTLALELDVHVDRAEHAIRHLIALGLIERGTGDATG